MYPYNLLLTHTHKNTHTALCTVAKRIHRGNDTHIHTYTHVPTPSLAHSHSYKHTHTYRHTPAVSAAPPAAELLLRQPLQHFAQLRRDVPRVWQLLQQKSMRRRSRSRVAPAAAAAAAVAAGTQNAARWSRCWLHALCQACYSPLLALLAAALADPPAAAAAAAVPLPLCPCRQ